MTLTANQIATLQAENQQLNAENERLRNEQITDPHDPRFRTLWEIGHRLAQQGHVTNEFDRLRSALGLDPLPRKYRVITMASLPIVLEEEIETTDRHEAESQASGITFDIIQDLKEYIRTKYDNRIHLGDLTATHTRVENV